jgi:hypothetical protein
MILFSAIRRLPEKTSLYEINLLAEKTITRIFAFIYGEAGYPSLLLLDFTRVSNFSF